MTEQIDITKLELWQLWKIIAEQQSILFQTQNNINMLQAEIQRRERETVPEGDYQETGTGIGGF